VPAWHGPAHMSGAAILGGALGCLIWNFPLLRPSC
jgi:hypothetical protein